MLNPLEVAASSVGYDGSFSGQSEVPKQWWREVDSGYRRYLETIHALGGTTQFAPPRKQQPQQQIDPHLIQQLMNSPNVVRFGGSR